MGTQVSWLLPAALLMGVALLLMAGRAPRTDRTRAAVVLWGGSLLATAAVFTLAQGIIHGYYSVALAPGIAALVGVGIAIGVGTAALLARLLASLLYGVGALDPIALAAAGVALLVVGLLAAFVPARRAGTTDPALVLREQ